MRKVTKSAVVCDKCGSELKSEEYDHFCDHCKMKTGKDPFSVEIFWKGDCKEVETLDFCCFEHVREWLLNFPYNKEEVQFIVLPYITNLDDMQALLNDK